MAHQSVLLEQVLEILNPQPGQIYIDATVNGGGHAMAILERISPGGVLVGIDRDCDLIEQLRHQVPSSKFRVHTKLVCDNYTNIKKIAAKEGITGKADGVLFDLGFSSYHIEQSGRGFSFAKDEPLDMRYNPSEVGLTAEEIVNRWTEDELADILQRFGEERFAGRIARGIIAGRKSGKIVSTKALAEIVVKCVPLSSRKGRLHPATRTFQALRLAVNKELESLEKVLPQAVSLLAPSGKLAVISFHSLEDRIVKTFMREEKRRGTIRLLTPKPIRPLREEILQNRRSRSARLRSAIKI